MKTAVVFYSRDGNTRLTASIIAQISGADVYELEEVKKRGRSAGAFMCAGFAAATRKKSKLKNAFTQEMHGYERIYIGTPVWAGKPTPAVNTFVDALDNENAEIIIFTVQGDRNTENLKCAEILKAELSKKCKVLDIAGYYGAGLGKTLSEAEMKKQVEAKVF